MPLRLDTEDAQAQGRGPGDSAVGPLGVIWQHPIGALLMLTFGLTWLFEIPWVLDTRGALPFAFPFWGVLLMAGCPALPPSSSRALPGDVVR